MPEQKDRPDYLKMSHGANRRYGMDKTDVGLDRPDREKITKELIEAYKLGIDSGKTGSYFSDAEARDSHFGGVAESLAIIPDIEEIDELRTRLTDLEKKLDDREEDLIEAKKQERERIKLELSEFVNMLRRAPEMHGDVQSDPLKTQEFLIWWQALKEDKIKEENNGKEKGKV